MNVNEKIYTEMVAFRTIPELKELFLYAQSLDKAEFTAMLIDECEQFIANKGFRLKKRQTNEKSYTYIEGSDLRRINISVNADI